MAIMYTVSLQAVWLCDVLEGLWAYGSKEWYCAYNWSEFCYYDTLLADMRLQTLRRSIVYEDLLCQANAHNFKLVLTHRG